MELSIDFILNMLISIKIVLFPVIQKISSIIELIAKYVNFLSVFSHSNERQYAIVIYCEL